MRERSGRALSLALAALAAASPQALAAGVTGQTTVVSQATALQKPDDPLFYDSARQNVLRFLLRQDARIPLTKRVRLDVGAYALAQSFSADDAFDRSFLESTDARHRTLELERHFHHTSKDDALWALDRFELSAQIGRGRVAVGRFPVDLSKTFIYRPNDFFGPFRPYQFDRTHKLGVDAAQLSYPIGNLGELRWINVAGFVSSDPLKDGSPQARNTYTAGRASSLLHAANTFGGYYTALFAGRLGERRVVGASLEGEVAGDASIHLDFHQKLPEPTKIGEFELAAGFDRPVGASTILQAEVYHHGAGKQKQEDYGALKLDAYHPVTNLGRYYAAGAAAYTFQNRSDLKFVHQVNLTDSSGLTTLVLRRPIGERYEASLTLSKSSGTPPEQGELRSEYGAYPDSLGVEMSALW